MSGPLKVMLVAVEASADTLGAGLARALKARLGDGVTFVGVGGAKMAAEGIASPVDIAGLSLVGLFEIAGAVPRALRDIETTVRLAEREQPDVAVLIDSWEFTWRIARRLRLRTPGVAIVKYVAPQVWATRPGRARVLARLSDRLLTLLDFEAPLFEAAGLATTFVGNPTMSRDVSDANGGRLRSLIGAGEDDPVLLILPGSRPGEIKRIMPAFEDAVMRLKEQRPELQLVVAAADTVAETVKARVAGWRHRAHVVEGEAARLDAMKAATVALAKSGTVTTELAIAGCPMVVAYRGHPMTALAARIVIQVRWLTLINIAAGREIAPEFLQERCNGPELARAVAALLDDPPRRAAQAAEQTAALAGLGVGVADPYGAAADAVIEVMRARG
ncbi:MAG TPA: lipid-A-disaccharide synthase [Caulobacteraceae bacterium]